LFAFLAQIIWDSDFKYVELACFGLKLDDYIDDEAIKDTQDTHGKGTLKDVNFMPVSSRFAFGIPLGIA